MTNQVLNMIVKVLEIAAAEGTFDSRTQVVELLLGYTDLTALLI